MSDQKKNMKDAVNSVMGKLDYNQDGKVDIQDIIMLAITKPGIYVNREAFLRKELSLKYTTEQVNNAVEKTPSIAGIPSAEIDNIADEVIRFERNCVSGISAALGVPGGYAMIATVPADIIQYYGYTLRAAQKLLYLYGFPELKIGEYGLELDTYTINEIILCLGIMNGVAGANNAVKGMAKALAVGVEKKLLNTALTKGAFYPFVKQVMKWFGVNLTKSIFAGFFKKAIPVVGGVVGGGITFFAFKPCCYRLKDTLKDTMLSNPEHKETKEENDIYNEIIEVENVEVEILDEDVEGVNTNKEDTASEIIEQGEYVLKKTNTGVKFDYKDINGKVVATSEVYKSKSACMNGLKSVMTNAPIAALEDHTLEEYENCKNPKFELLLDKAGDYRFRLKAKNGQIIAVSAAYKKKSSCLKGIESLRGSSESIIKVAED